MRGRVDVPFAAALLATFLIVPSQPPHAGDNIEGPAILPATTIVDKWWDRRFYDGTPGYDGSVAWSYNPGGAPAGFGIGTVVATFQAGFRAWSRLDDFVGGDPLVPDVRFAGLTTIDRFVAVDGVNVILWSPLDGPGGVLAATPCTSLTAPTATVAGPSGETLLPIGRRTVPFPGPPGVTYDTGTIIDCGALFDSSEPWTLGPGRDLLAVATHEFGHYLGLSHSTIGLDTEDSTDDATMIPFIDDSTNLRTPKVDDAASAIRSYSRVNGLTQAPAGLARIIGYVGKNPGCTTPAYGVSIRAYPTDGDFNDPLAVETFSGSWLRQGLPGEPADASFELNVVADVDYTLAAIVLSNNFNAAFSRFRFNVTTVLTNTGSNPETILDGVAAVPAPAPGETVDLGVVGILGCEPP